MRLNLAERATHFWRFFVFTNQFQNFTEIVLMFSSFNSLVPSQSKQQTTVCCSTIVPVGNKIKPLFVGLHKWDAFIAF